MILAEVAERLGCLLRGDGKVEVSRVAGIDEAGPGDLTFVANPRYVQYLAQTRASAVIVAPEVETALPSLLTAQPYLAFAQAVALFHPEHRPAPGVHPTAVVDPSAVLAASVHIGPLAVIGPRVRVGARTVIQPQVVLYPGVVVGDDCLLHSGVQVREGCRLGNRVVIQNGAVVGADGFGFAKDGEGRYQKIPQIGVVVIEDDVEIGALTAVDRASLAVTRIGRGTKIDNLVQIGHSVSIGEHSVMAAQVGIAGSVKVGKGVILAGQVGVVGHITLGDGVIVTAQSGIPGSLEPGSVVSGSPAFDNRSWLKVTAASHRLPELMKRVRELERRLADLEAAGGKTP